MGPCWPQGLKSPGYIIRLKSPHGELGGPPARRKQPRGQIPWREILPYIEHGASAFGIRGLSYFKLVCSCLLASESRLLRAPCTRSHAAGSAQTCPRPGRAVPVFILVRNREGTGKLFPSLTVIHLLEEMPQALGWKAFPYVPSGPRACSFFPWTTRARRVFAHETMLCKRGVQVRGATLP